MKVGEQLLVSCMGYSHLCEIEGFDSDRVNLKIIERDCSDASLPIEIYLFQGLPKSDKMELIIQKAVQLGVSEIIPVEMKRCVVKLEPKKADSKITRWQAIAESAAKQSKRTIIPEVHDAITIKQLKNCLSDFDILLVPYESKNGMQDTKTALEKITSGMTVGILIGPEGGFDESEIKAVTDMGAHVISLGKRILRTETAAITALSMCMLYAEMNLGE
jgi:16S rRNA (uracil1498-N3)-methyltransferase